MHKHNAPFQTTTRDLNQAAIAMAAGYYVEVYRQPAGRRALFSFDDVPELQDLINRYERKECLPLPAKIILQARTELFHQAQRVCREGL